MDEMMRAMGLPVGFGKVSKRNAQVAPLPEPITQHKVSEETEEEDDLGPMPADTLLENEQDMDDSKDLQEEEEDEEEEDTWDDLPITNKVTLKGHTKVRFHLYKYAHLQDSLGAHR